MPAGPSQNERFGQLRHATLDDAALTRVRLVGVVVLLLISVLLGVLADRDGGPLAAQVFDRYQRLQPRPVADSPVRVIAIDELSLLNYGAWPWPRNYLVALHETAIRHGARAVGYDLIFPEPDRHGAERLSQIYASMGADVTDVFGRLPDLDAYLADSIARLPVVVARVGMREDETGMLAERVPALTARVLGGVDDLVRYPYALVNLPDIDDFAAGHGLLNGLPDADGVVRRMLLVAEVAGDAMPALSLELLRVANGASEIHLGEDGLRVGDILVESEPQAILRPWFSPPLTQRYVSAADVFDESFPEDAFRDRIVIIGPAALGLEDVVPTPLVSESYGVDLHAQAIEIMLSGEWLRRLPIVERMEWSLLAVLGLLAVLWLPRMALAPGVVVLLVTILGLVGAGWAAFSGARILFDPTLPASGLFVTALALFGMLSLETDRLSVRIEREREQLRESLHQTQIEHARVDGELAAAHDIQMGILPAADQIEKLPGYVKVAALLEPAREIGGDLYDVFMLDNRHLYFVVGDVTGKGVPAALFMAICKALTGSAVLHHGQALQEAIGAANRLIIRENPASQFITVLAGILDCDTGEVVLVNAGHDDPYRLRAGEPPRKINCDGGPPLCFMKDFDYPLDWAQLVPGDRILILTDGISEARDRDGTLFGNERLEALLASLPDDIGNDEIIARIQAAVREFEDGQPPTDDMTLMVISYAPTAGEVL